MSSEGEDWGKYLLVHQIYAIFVMQIAYFFLIENQLDSDNEKDEESKKAKTANKFDDEDQVDPEEVAK